jgi:hypothetical protein
MIFNILLYIPYLIFYTFRNLLFIKSKSIKEISNAINIFEQTTARPGRINFMTCMNYIQQHGGRYLLCRQIDIERDVYITDPIGPAHFHALVNLMEVMRKVEITEDISDDKYLFMIDYIVKNDHKYMGIDGKVEVDFLSSPENLHLYLRMLSVARLSYTNKLRAKLNLIYKPFLLLVRK